MQYTVAVFPFRAAGFATKYKDAAVSEYAVEICSLRSRASREDASRLPGYGIGGGGLMDLTGLEKN